jgi:hypothetical protein
MFASLAGNLNNIETYCFNRDCVESPVTTAVGGRGEGVCRLTAKPNVTWATRFNVTWGSDLTWKKKGRTVTIQPFVQTLCNLVVSCLLPVYCLTFVCSVFFGSIQCFVCFSVRLFSVFFCSDTGILFQIFWSCDHINNNHPAVNKHHTSDSAIFVLQ